MHPWNRRRLICGNQSNILGDSEYPYAGQKVQSIDISSKKRSGALGNVPDGISFSCYRTAYIAVAAVDRIQGHSLLASFKLYHHPLAQTQGIFWRCARITLWGRDMHAGRSRKGMAQHLRVNLGSFTAMRYTVASLRCVPQSMQSVHRVIQSLFLFDVVSGYLKQLPCP